MSDATGKLSEAGIEAIRTRVANQWLGSERRLLAHIDAERAEKAKPPAADVVAAADAIACRWWNWSRDPANTHRDHLSWLKIELADAFSAWAVPPQPTPQQVEDATILRDAVARLKKLGEDYHADAVGHVADRLGGTVPER